MRVLLAGLIAFAMGAALSCRTLAQGTDKFERTAPAKPTPAEREISVITAATDPRLRVALAGIASPLPQELTLRPLGAGVPAQFRAFYGVWTGTFEGGRGRACTAVIDSITGTGAMILHSWGPIQNNKADLGFFRVRGRFEGGALRGKDQQRSVDYRILDDGSLELTIEHQQGTFRARMKRVY